MTSEGTAAQVVRLVIELSRDQDHLVAHVRSQEPLRDFGVVPLHELTLLLEAVAADADT